MISEETAVPEKVDCGDRWRKVTRDLMIKGVKYIAHCISADMSLDAGVAEQIRTQLGV